MTDLHAELKTLIVEALRLEDLTPEEIDSQASLFGDDGLGLDSLDVLELAVALEYKYGFKLELDQDEGRRVFASIDTLADFVSARRTQ